MKVIAKGTLLSSATKLGLSMEIMPSTEGEAASLEAMLQGAVLEDFKINVKSMEIDLLFDKSAELPVVENASAAPETPASPETPVIEPPAA